jgi:hypothetical protein
LSFLEKVLRFLEEFVVTVHLAANPLNPELKLFALEATLRTIVFARVAIGLLA